MKTAKKRISAEPEFLSRKDVKGGMWKVGEVRAVRGEPWTNIVTREMKVPTDDDPLARAIRAHEMVHAKVSPANDWEKWIDRKIATHQSMVAVEELRVNYLCQKAGFDVKSDLADGGEMADGERLGATEDWVGAVQMAVATAGTASNKLLLNGIRRHKREWGPILLDISKRAVKEMKKSDKYSQLASTEIDTTSGLYPMGFIHTERLAEWVDRLCAKSPEQIAEEKEKARREREEARIRKALGQDADEAEGEDGEASEGTGRHSNKGITPNDKGKDDGNPYKGITSSNATYRVAEWQKLNIEFMPMPILSKGNLGKRRVASNMGMRPRRMHRMITDPQMRIFDKVVRGTGGVVIIDGSGSMSFSREQLTKIIENAPGATVAVYTDRGDSNMTNLWVVAHKGKMVNELPSVGQGNGVDFPAIEWGVKQKQTSRSPIVWVTDGGVCGKNGNFEAVLAMQCINFCKKNNIIVVPHVDEAVEQLKNLKFGNKAESIYPEMFKNTFKQLNGTELI
jgi:hypothetical protein